MAAKFRILTNIYFDPAHPASFSSVYKLYKAANFIDRSITLDNAKKFLRNTKTYTRYKRSPRSFPRRKTIVSGINDQWQIDLISTLPLVRYFRRCAYIVACIDCFSRQAYIEPVPSKKADVVLSAFRVILRRAGTTPRVLQKDLGTEFFGPFTRFLVEHNIHYFSSPSSQKCAIVERFNRTIQNKIYRFVSANLQLTYNDLQDIVRSYNHTKHRTLGIAPVDVTPANEYEIWLKQYADYIYSKKQIPLKVGDKVLISKLKTVFSRGYQTHFRPEILQVALVLRTFPPTFVLKDRNNTIVPGTFYLQQLSKIEGA